LRAWSDPHDPGRGNSLEDHEIYRSTGTSQVCQDVDCLKSKVDEFTAMRMRYKARGPNSNTFVGWAGTSCGLGVASYLPVGAYGGNTTIKD